jgi:hypothetical protein
MLRVIPPVFIYIYRTRQPRVRAREQLLLLRLIWGSEAVKIHGASTRPKRWIKGAPLCACECAPLIRTHTRRRHSRGKVGGLNVSEYVVCCSSEESVCACLVLRGSIFKSLPPLEKAHAPYWAHYAIRRADGISRARSWLQVHFYPQYLHTRRRDLRLYTNRLLMGSGDSIWAALCRRRVVRDTWEAVSLVPSN